MNKINVFIIAQEEPFYLPKVIRYLIEHQPQQVNFIGATRLNPHRKNKIMKDWLLERTAIYTYWELFITFCFFAYAKIWTKCIGFFGAKNYFSVKVVCAEFSIKEIETDDINSDNYIKQLQQLNIDVILSISPPQLFQKELLNLPKIACLNAHGTLLPKHRGVFGSWWMLFENDEEIGTTIHTMEERLDAGEIVWQKAIPTPKNATQYSIAYHTKKIMAEGIITTLVQLSEKKLTSIAPSQKTSYHKAPTKEQSNIFHKQGKRIVTWANAKLTLANRF